MEEEIGDDTSNAMVLEDNPNGEEEWEVEEILGVRKTMGVTQVQVKWIGYTKPTWEPPSNSPETEALDRYEDAHREITEDNVRMLFVGCTGTSAFALIAANRSGGIWRR